MLVLAAIGLSIIAYLLWTIDFSSVAKTIVAIGFWFPVLAALRLSIIAVMASGWWCLFDQNHRRTFSQVFCARWIGESINNLLPVAQVGGDVARARLVGRATGTWPVAAASVAVDMTWNLVGQVVLASVGAWQMAAKIDNLPMMSAALIVSVLPLVGIACGQRPAVLRRLGRLFTGLFNRDQATTEHSAELFGRALAAIYARKRSNVVAIACHLMAAGGRAAEVWLFLRITGQDVTALDAVMIEGLSSALRTALFFLPAGLGAQEGALVLLCSWVGLPPATGLALALTKRARELIVNGTGLLVWFASRALRR